MSTRVIRRSNSSLTTVLTNTKSLTASNTTAAVPLFRVTGSVEFLRLWGVVTTVLGSNVTAAYWRLNDQTAQVNISLNTGTTLSSAAAGSLITRNSVAGVALVLANATAGRVTDPVAATAPAVIMPFAMTQKPAANTDIEFVYSTTNTPTSGAIQFFVEFRPLSADGSVAAV